MVWERIRGRRGTSVGDPRRGQWDVLRTVAVLVYVPLAVLFGIVIVVRLSTGIAIAEFTRDPLGFTGLPVYKGALSNLGVVIWSAAAAVCLFSYAVIRASGARDVNGQFLLAAGLITVVLMLDDLYMFHEVVLPQHIGIAEEVAYASYAAIIVWFIVRYRATILQTEYVLLALGLAGFGLAVVVDIVAALIELRGTYVFEDGGKLFGIASWTAYFVLVSAREIASLAVRHVPDSRVASFEHRRE